MVKLLTLIDQCLNMSHLKQIHSHLTVSGQISTPFFATRLISLYSHPTYSNLRHVNSIFTHIPNKTLSTYNSMIRWYIQNKKPTNAISIYKQMLVDVTSPNNYTFSFVLAACRELTGNPYLSYGIHAHVVKLGWECYDFVRNGLIHLYSKCDRINEARKLFDTSLSLNSDVIMWTAMISGYLKCGRVSIARKLFDQMPQRNDVTWSAMVNGYAQAGMFEDALGLFYNMLARGFRANRACIVGALSACSSLGGLDQGRWIHTYIDRNKFALDRILGAALVDMYAKCGCIKAAEHVFCAMPCKDVFSFTSLISGFSNHGESSRALEVFKEMEGMGVVPNEVTFICVLSACSRMGLVEEGVRIFESMKRVYGIEPLVQHYGCIVDLLGRAGILIKAKEVVREMPMEPDSYVLGALLNACSVHSDIQLGEETVESLVQHSLDHSGVHVLLANIYASAKNWDNMKKVRKRMEENRVRKVPGVSSIEIDGVACEFVAGDISHVLFEKIVSMQNFVDNCLKFIPNDDQVEGLGV